MMLEGLSKNTAYVEAISIETLYDDLNVFNIEVDDYHTCFVGKNCVLVHNKCHNNSLNSEETNYGYALKDSDTNRILKYGESIYKYRRYSKRFYSLNNCYMDVMVSGSKREIHQWQHEKIIGYVYITGETPPMNNSTW